jgi:biopolymer transport protein ExbD
MLKRKKNEVSIPTSSMADIAFLLLIFFLVATVIDVDSGIGLTLPDISELPPQPPTPDRMAAILINEHNEVMLNGELILLDGIKGQLKSKIESKIELPKNKKLIVSLRTDRKTIYNTYIKVLDQIKMAYFEVRDEYSNAAFGDKFNDLDEEDQKVVKEAIPIIISIAEPELVK